MPSERVRRRIDRLLDQAEEALDALDWARVGEIAGAVLVVDPENEDARSFLAMAEHNLGGQGQETLSGSPLPAGAGRAEGEGRNGDRDVGADSDPPEGRPLPTPAREAGSGEGAPSNVLPLPSAGEGREPVLSPSKYEGDQTPASFANGRYTVQDFLGEGGKKRVYRAHDTLLDREVAFALIKTEDLDEASRSRITREAQAMGRLGTHPNIVTVFDLGVEGESPYIVTELMGGGDVEGLIPWTTVGAGDGPPTPSPQSSPAEGREATDGDSKTDVRAYGDTPSSQQEVSDHPEALEGRSEAGLPLEQTIEIGKSICEGLQFAHSREIVHRDLKPGNVWLTEEGTAKIGDFGLAMMTDRTRLTREAVMVGTVSYMPPEQATGGEITPRADLYSLGAMLYEMVTGRPPFLGDDDIAIIGQHINTAPVAPTWHNGNCPRPLEALIMRLLSKDPAERPESAQDAYNALNTIDLTARGESVEQDATSLESLAGGVFVGRQAEMDQLKAALEDVLGGSGRLVTLVGEPGIGKTRTSEELATYAGLRGAQVLWGRCYETGGQPPYWPWVQAIRSYVREIDPDELRRQMGSSASVVAEVVTDVKDRLPEVQPPPTMDDPESARFRLFDSITSFLKSASQAQPLVLVLDDLHWSDQPSLAFLEFMARELGQTRVMLICTYRDMELNRRHPLTVTLGDLARERLYERVLLRGVAEQDVARFIEIAAGFSPPSGLSETVHRHTEGNPLFVTEVVRELVQSGELNRARSGAGSSWSIRIPEGAREVIGRRLDRLSERANDVLTIASIVGRQFTLDSLRALSDELTETQLLDVLDEVLGSRVVEELSSSPGDYQFTHALFQETFLGELSAARRVRLHARVAEALEKKFGDAADDHANDLVTHFAEAEPVLGPEKLIHYSTIAGTRALSAFAYEAAVTHLRRAADALGEELDSESAADILSQLGFAQIATQDEIGAVDSLKAAFKYYAGQGPPEKAFSVISQPLNVGMIVSLQSEIRHAVELTHDESIQRASALVPFSWVQYWNGDVQGGLEAIARARDLASAHDEPLIEMRALAMEANIAGFELRNEDSLGAAEAALELAESHPDPETEMRARLWQTTATMGIGSNDGGYAVGTGFLDAALNLGHGVWVNRAMWAPVKIALYHGDWERAGEYAEMISRFAPADSHVIRLTIGLWTGDFVSAEEEWDAFLDEVPHTITEDGSPEFHANVGASIWLPITGLDTVNPDHPLAKKLNAGYIRAHMTAPTSRMRIWMVNRIRGLILLDDREAVRDLYEVIREPLEQIEITARGLAPQSLGHMAVYLERYEEAMDHFGRAIEICRRYGYGAALASVLADTANCLRLREGDGNAARVQEAEDEALAIAQDLGMRPLTERILKRREILKA